MLAAIAGLIASMVRTCVVDNTCRPVDQACMATIGARGDSGSVITRGALKAAPRARPHRSAF